jgi:hypothetical protein
VKATPKVEYASFQVGPAGIAKSQGLRMFTDANGLKWENDRTGTGLVYGSEDFSLAIFWFRDGSIL